MLMEMEVEMERKKIDAENDGKYQLHNENKNKNTIENKCKKDADTCNWGNQEISLGKNSLKEIVEKAEEIKAEIIKEKEIEIEIEELKLTGNYDNININNNDNNNDNDNKESSGERMINITDEIINENNGNNGNENIENNGNENKGNENNENNENSPLIWGCILCSTVTRNAADRAFSLHKRAMNSPSVISFLGDAFDDVENDRV